MAIQEQDGAYNAWREPRPRSLILGRLSVLGKSALRAGGYLAATVFVLAALAFAGVRAWLLWNGV